MGFTKNKMNRPDIIENYRDNALLRNEYFNFISTIFPSANFKEWYSKGFWRDEHDPVSIIKDDKIISNVSAAKMNIIVEGKNLKGIQFGAVGTLLEFRNKGLSRFLMEFVIERYKNNIDIFLLFANETVLDFYPKFGFKRFEEKVFISEINIPEPKPAARKLNIQNESDYLLLQNLINNRVEITKIFGAKDYGFITNWHVLNSYHNKLYYLKDEDAIFIMKEKKRQLHLYEIICKKYFDLDSVLPKVIESSETISVKFYFPPDQLNYKYDKIINEDNGLFILGDFEFTNEFFKFPETAIT